MMTMSLQLIMKQELELTGGVTQSVFPRSERWLQKKTEHQRALLVLFERADDDRLDQYHSVMDAVYCETFPDEQEACFAYYDDDGPKLNELKSKSMLKKLDAFLLRTLQFAHQLYVTKLEATWAEFSAFVAQKTTAGVSGLPARSRPEGEREET